MFNKLKAEVLKLISSTIHFKNQLFFSALPVMLYFNVCKYIKLQISFTTPLQILTPTLRNSANFHMHYNKICPGKSYGIINNYLNPHVQKSIKYVLLRANGVLLRDVSMDLTQENLVICSTIEKFVG